DMDGLRALIGQLIHCAAEDIAFTLNACSALSLFLGGIDWTPGDKIVTLTDEFPNHYYYASLLARKGAELIELPEIVRLPAGTRAVVISSVNYMNGYRPDLDAVSQLVKNAGALLYIDGTQSLGALRFDVAKVRPDMFAVDGYKWLLCPNGASFFYISPELRERLEPAVVGWRSDRGWRKPEELNHGMPQLPEGAERYEGGMLAFPVLYGMAECVRMFLEVGPAAIEERVLSLAAQTAAILKDSGARIRHEGSNIVAAHWLDRDASSLARGLESQGIAVAARHGNLRVSPHFYNNREDLDILAAALA
ncbi:MAG: aminotransferase class V-fold PLP-dependent enzyme, partial [Acidobacteriota bacterium]|nr:aminotransferase class V-fold PLP-dependent enzyme [Acidobacteriota bacterium]